MPGSALWLELQDLTSHRSTRNDRPAQRAAAPYADIGRHGQRVGRTDIHGRFATRSNANPPGRGPDPRPSRFRACTREHSEPALLCHSAPTARHLRRPQGSEAVKLSTARPAGVVARYWLRPPACDGLHVPCAQLSLRRKAGAFSGLAYPLDLSRPCGCVPPDLIRGSGPLATKSSQLRRRGRTYRSDALTSRASVASARRAVRCHAQRLSPCSLCLQCLWRSTACLMACPPQKGRARLAG